MLSTACSGDRAIVLHPMTGADYFIMKAGQTYTAPGDGAFVSNEFQKEVMKVRVEEARR